ncbi:MAG: hypothetical protein SGPRY_001742, partial [Prymnesium sp.]
MARGGGLGASSALSTARLSRRVITSLPRGSSSSKTERCCRHHEPCSREGSVGRRKG